MKSPLKTYKEICKEFGITGDKSLHIRQKIAFFGEQANQQKQIINRLIGDLAKARLDLEASTDPAAKAAYSKKAAEFSEDLRQFTNTLDFFLTLEKELSEDNPDVKATSADIPESF